MNDKEIRTFCHEVRERRRLALTPESESKLQEQLQASMGALIERHGYRILQSASLGDSYLTLTLAETNAEYLKPVVEYLRPGTTALAYYGFQFDLEESGKIKVLW